MDTPEFVKYDHDHEIQTVQKLRREKFSSPVETCSQIASVGTPPLLLHAPGLAKMLLPD